MSYEAALTAAGAEVHLSRHFGDYQGDWWAKVSFQDSTFWVHGAFGSCSGCDAFEAEFQNYDYEEDQSDSYQKHLARFGLTYLQNDAFTQEEAIKHASRDLDWDVDAQEMVDWLKANAL